MQLIGRSWAEADLLRIAHAYAQTARTTMPPRPTLRAGPERGAGRNPKDRAAGSAGFAGLPNDGAIIAWMRAYADAMGLDFLTPEDFGPMAAQLKPIKSQLARARLRLPELFLTWPAG
jgi:hypothetical protein